MKYYGIEICRFCGVDVSTNAPTILPEFIACMVGSVKSFIVSMNTVDIVDFICVMNKSNNNVFRAIYSETDTETFIAKTTGNRGYSPIVNMEDYDIN